MFKNKTDALADQVAAQKIVCEHANEQQRRSLRMQIAAQIHAQVTARLANSTDDDCVIICDEEMAMFRACCRLIQRECDEGC